ncbi:hypothetical protein RVR_10594 [Actinacidiphila reveromycinica]|uniref:Uncharacterized protein n=1 Tax=Actinacidiphila reveromycinica TaxID=659352 RepID=A0A7U3VR99_9ACTN|nr:hypothetical protein [Streptomyces sp. SN-593]BBB00595.1 hypothetical protein RVR_7730 [Streptomyces sp. SN-593]BBB00648.1 hypothetical protein RVR_10594 [Streptomyces sp. SN-593]
MSAHRGRPDRYAATPVGVLVTAGAILAVVVAVLAVTAGFRVALLVACFAVGGPLAGTGALVAVITLADRVRRPRTTAPGRDTCQDIDHVVADRPHGTRHRLVTTRP